VHDERGDDKRDTAEDRGYEVQLRLREDGITWLTLILRSSNANVAIAHTSQEPTVYDVRARSCPSNLTKEELMGVIAWIIFGLIAGVIAKLLMPGRDPGGCIITILLGIVGAFVGGFIFEQLTGRPDVMRFDFGSLVVAVIGAIIVLLIYRLIAGRRA
jgi:uncharacterized membrane protein YeaQ/YmgE (transglycosylase-associated protein family)